MARERRPPCLLLACVLACLAVDSRVTAALVSHFEFEGGSLSDSGALDNGVNAYMPRATSQPCMDAGDAGFLEDKTSYTLRAPPRGLPSGSEPWEVGFYVMPQEVKERTLIYMGGFDLSLDRDGRIKCAGTAGARLYVDEWVHITIVYDGQVITVIVDGFPLETSIVLDLDPSEPIVIGGHPNPAKSDTRGAYFIDELVVATGSDTVGTPLCKRTSAPVTLVPTPAPPTPLPPTPAPPTPVPNTVSPPTLVPPTPAPSTASPPTPVPPTMSPPTLVPPTPAPSTASPPTPVPPTVSPPTPVPQTDVPPSPVPPTASPLTSVPQTLAPPTPVPQTEVPPTPVPATLAPTTPVPPTVAPSTPAPSTLSPPTPAPQTDVPPSPVPPTASPFTPVPSTSPPTAVPTTVSPPTPVPATVAPTTPVPLTPVPSTLLPPTLAPLTPSPPTLTPPATMVPPTLLPSTAPPTTPVPPTASLTSVPATFEPAAYTARTLMPWTAFPGTSPTSEPLAASPTPHPTTPGPTTDAPTEVPQITPSPVSDVPLPRTSDETKVPAATKVRAQKFFASAEDAGGGVAAVSAVSGGSAVGSALQLIVLGQVCIPYEATNIAHRSRIINPLQLRVSDSPAAGMLVGNVFLVVVGGCALYIFVRTCKVLLSRCSRSGDPSASKPLQGVYARDYFMTGSLFSLRVLYTGITLGAADLLIWPEDPLLVALGAVAMVTCVSLPAVIFHILTTLIPEKAFYLLDALTAHDPCLRWLLGPGEWVSASRTELVANRLSSLIRSYRVSTSWFVSVDFLALLALSLNQALQRQVLSWVGCGHIKAASGVVITILLATKVYLRPHIRGFVNFCDILAHALQGIAMCAMAHGYYQEQEDHPAFALSATLLFGSAAALAVRCAGELAAEIGVFCTGRRRRLQQTALDIIDQRTRGVAAHENAAALPAAPVSTATGAMIDWHLRSLERRRRGARKGLMRIGAAGYGGLRPAGPPDAIITSHELMYLSDSCPVTPSGVVRQRQCSTGTVPSAHGDDSASDTDRATGGGGEGTPRRLRRSFDDTAWRPDTSRGRRRSTLASVATPTHVPPQRRGLADTYGEMALDMSLPVETSTPRGRTARQRSSFPFRVATPLTPAREGPPSPTPDQHAGTPGGRRSVPPSRMLESAEVLAYARRYSATPVTPNGSPQASRRRSDVSATTVFIL